MALPLRTGIKGNHGSFSRLFWFTRVSKYSTYSRDDVEDLVPKVKREHPETLKPDVDPLKIIKGKVWDKKPFKIELEAGKRYSWCACGYSKNQPFCDGSHKPLHLQLASFNEMQHIKPHRFKVEETKEYWLCNCKQTDNRPFCDGSHKKPEVAELKKGPGFNF